MAVGGVSGSTAGGIKINTLMVLLVAAFASLKGRPNAEVFRRELPYSQIARAIALAALVTAVFMALIVLLAATENANIARGQVLLRRPAVRDRVRRSAPWAYRAASRAN